jgi:aminopeptidase N
MGDKQFLAMLGELRREYEYKTITIEEFRQLACKYLPPKFPDPKLENFFDEWVYDTGIPSLKLKYSISGKAPAVKLSGTVTQTDVGESFSVPVPVEIQFGKAKSMTHWVRTGEEAVSFSLTLRQAPTKVVLDPTGTVLARK